MAGKAKGTGTHAGAGQAKPADLKAEYAERYPRNLHKELWGHVDQRAENSLYRWWWEFLRAARDFPEFREELATGVEGTNLTPRGRKRLESRREEEASRLGCSLPISKSPEAGARNADEMAKVDADFGDLGSDFLSWWRARGMKLFEEHGVPLIQVLKPDSPDDAEYKRKTGVVIIVPMTISRELILEQFGIMLDIYHPGSELKRHEHSTAKRKIFAKQRYRNVKPAEMNEMIGMWRAQRENLRQEEKRQAPLWRVYCRFKNDEKLERQLEDPDNFDARTGISKQAEQLYKQADELMRNAVLGEFPKDSDYQKIKHGKKG